MKKKVEPSPGVDSTPDLARVPVVPGSSYWNIGLGGLGPEDVEGDEKGLMTPQMLGANLAWLLKLINA